MKVVRLSALHTGRLYPQEIFLVLISVRGWITYIINMKYKICVIQGENWKIKLTSN